MASLADYLRTNQNNSTIQPVKPVASSVTTASPSSTSPALKTPAAQTFIKNQAPSVAPTAPVDNTSKINDINSQVTDLQKQQQGLKDNNFTDTNQLDKNSNGQYVPSSYESAKADYTKAYTDYINTLNPSTETTAAKTAYNDYVSEANAGISGIEGQGRGIPLTIVRGQKAKLRDQALQKESLLQGDIGIAQANDASRQNAGLAGVSLKEKLLGMQQSPTDKAKALAESKKSEADLAKTKADTAKAEGETAMLGKMTEYQKAQLAQDESQFGRTYALAQLKASQDAVASPNSPASVAAKDAEATSNINLINTLLLNPNLGAITGGVQGGLKLGNLDPRSNTQLAINQYNQVKGALSLENRSKLKGQGAVSDFEGKTLEQAASSLGRNISEDEFKKQLKQIKGSIATSHGLTADVLITDPNSGKSQVVNSSSAGIAQAIKDGAIVEYK